MPVTFHGGKLWGRSIVASQQIPNFAPRIYAHGELTDHLLLTLIQMFLQISKFFIAKKLWPVKTTGNKEEPNLAVFGKATLCCDLLSSGCVYTSINAPFLMHI